MGTTDEAQLAETVRLNWFIFESCVRQDNCENQSRKVQENQQSGIPFPIDTQINVANYLCLHVENVIAYSADTNSSCWKDWVKTIKVNLCPSFSNHAKYTSKEDSVAVNEYSSQKATAATKPKWQAIQKTQQK